MMRGLLVIERILRDRSGIWRQITDERDLPGLCGQLLASSCIALAIYGAVLGASNSVQQALSSAVKLPILFLVTLGICLPALYLFNLVFGARLSVRQAVALVLVAVTVIAMLTMALAPISLFFLITAPNYAFFKLLNVSVLTLSAGVGLRFLVDGMKSLNRLTPTPPSSSSSSSSSSPASLRSSSPAEVGAAPRVARVTPPKPKEPQPVSMGLLYVWIVLFGFVGTQLAWTLRPFFGSHDKPFELFRAIEGNFYVDVAWTIGRLL